MTLTDDQRKLLAWTVGLALFGVGYRIVSGIRLEQTSLLFIGLPAALAIVLTLTPRSDNAIVTALKGITIALGMSGALLGEGMVCILIAAPLFYLLALIIGIVAEIDKRRRNKQAKLLSVALVPLMLMSMEGVREEWSFHRAESVSVERYLALSPSEVRYALENPVAFDGPLPHFLRIGFPTPRWIRGSGLEPGARRIIRFAGGEGEPGDMTLEVVEHTESKVHFRCVSDDSKIEHWLDWKDSIVTFEAHDDGTLVTWRLDYDRSLDPAWYFAPMERYAVKLAAGVLIDNLELPR